MYNQNCASSLLAWRVLYYTYIVLPIAAGLDKFFYYLVNWNIYLNKAIPAALGTTPEMVNHVVGVIEICAGLLVFFKPRLGAYVVSLWLIAVVINLLSIGYYEGYAAVHYDIIVRDIGLAVGALALALLSKDIEKQCHAVDEPRMW
jgi:hypothetical protein